MFQYFCYIYDRYDKVIVTLAVVTSRYHYAYSTGIHYNYFGTQFDYANTNCKLTDYENSTEKSIRLKKNYGEMITDERHSDIEVQAK